MLTNEEMIFKATDEEGNVISMALSHTSLLMIQELVNNEFEKTVEEHSKAKEKCENMERAISSYPFEEHVETDEDGNKTYKGLPNQEERHRKVQSMRENLDNHLIDEVAMAEQQLKSLEQLYGIVHWVLEGQNEDPDDAADFLRGNADFDVIDRILDDED